MKVCPQCSQSKDESDFYKSNGKRKRLSGICKKCQSKAGTENVRKKKIRCIEYLGGKCWKCEYNKTYYSLVFHHIRDKKFSISDKLKCNFEKILQPELDKCILLCANCHGEFHEKIHKGKKENENKLSMAKF